MIIYAKHNNVTQVIQKLSGDRSLSRKRYIRQPTYKMENHHSPILNNFQASTSNS